MIDISKINRHYKVRKLNINDIEIILELLKKNTLFYKYTEAKPNREELINDINITPKGIDIKDKYFIGFFEGETLIAIMDLIDGYPKIDHCFIGLFMMNVNYQNKGIGSLIINELIDYLKLINKKEVQLAIDKGNPQSTSFWKKNKFVIFKEVDVNGWIKEVARRII